MSYHPDSGVTVLRNPSTRAKLVIHGDEALRRIKADLPRMWVVEKPARRKG